MSQTVSSWIQGVARARIHELDCLFMDARVSGTAQMQNDAVTGGAGYCTGYRVARRGCTWHCVAMTGTSRQAPRPPEDKTHLEHARVHGTGGTGGQLPGGERAR